MRALFQSSGMVSYSQIFLKRSVTTLHEVSALSISAQMESIPAEFPFFMALLESLTSASVGGLISISKMSPVAEGLAGSSGSGWLSTSWKYQLFLGRW